MNKGSGTPEPLSRLGCCTVHKAIPLSLVSHLTSGHERSTVGDMEATTTSETTYRVVLHYGEGEGSHLFMGRDTPQEAWADFDRISADPFYSEQEWTLSVRKTTITTTITEVTR